MSENTIGSLSAWNFALLTPVKMIKKMLTARPAKIGRCTIKVTARKNSDTSKLWSNIVFGFKRGGRGFSHRSGINEKITVNNKAMPNIHIEDAAIS